MSIRTKRILFGLGCLIVWFGFVMSGGALASFVISGLAGWFMGGLIYDFSKKVFPNDCNERADAYDKFVERLKTNYPKSFRNVYCGISISEGWFHIIENLCANAYSHVKWKREMRARELLQNRARARGREAVEKFVTKGRQPSLYDETRIEEILDNGPIKVTPRVRHIEVHQIKEKFGGLRFYYEGGDGEVSGMVRMAECWAAYTCEVCGERGTRRAGGWIRTLCDKHEAEHQ